MPYAAKLAPLAPTVLLFFLAPSAAALPGLAKPAPSPSPSALPSPPLTASADPELLTDAVPRGAVRQFLVETQKGNFGAAARYLELSGVPQDDREDDATLARQFRIILDHAASLDLESLSDRPEGLQDDGLPADRDRLVTVKTADGPVDLLLKRVPGPDGRRVWRVGSSTIRRVPQLWAQFGYPRFVERLPRGFTSRRFLEMEPWQWLGLAVLAALCWVLGFALTWILRRMVDLAVHRTHSDLDDRIVAALHRPLRLTITLYLFLAGSLYLSLAVKAQSVIVGVSKGLTVLLVAWMFMRVADLVAQSMQERLIREDRRSATSMVTLGRRAAKVLILALGVLGVLQNLGFNVTGILAGLGIGGLAVALAAQKTLENVFGGVVLTVDRPIRVGDTCRFGDKLGTVEDVGLRSTKVRTLDRTVVSVPNAELSSIQIENLTARDRFRLLAVLNLRYETSPDQMQWVLASIRDLLLAHPKIARGDAPIRVRLAGLAGHSLEAEVFCYVDTRDVEEFYAVREELFLKILDIVARSGTAFAFPSQTLYLGRDGGLDPARTAEAEKAAEQWRREGRS